MEFRVPDSYSPDEGNSSFREAKNGKKYVTISNIRWFTNLPLKIKPRPLDLNNLRYSPEKYPKYDNYDAINVDKVADIPCDYPGVMGVPLTFIDKFCPDQFEILGITSGRNEFSRKAWPTKKYVNPIQHNKDGSTKNGSKVNDGAVIITKNPKGVHYTADNQPNALNKIYTRILIKNKHPEDSKNQFFSTMLKEG